MFSRNSYRALCCTLLTLCIIACACAGKPKGSITREQVNAFLDEMEKASQNRDLETLMSHISTDAQFKVTIEGFGPTQTMNFNHDQYRDYMKQGFAAVEAYDYKRGKTIINIDPDGQSAFVGDESFESVTMGGRVIRSVTAASSTLKLEDGKLVIVSGEGVARPAPASPTTNRASF
jgi:hypothetical protein